MGLGPSTESRAQKEGAKIWHTKWGERLFLGGLMILDINVWLGFQVFNSSLTKNFGLSVHNGSDQNEVKTSIPLSLSAILAAQPKKNFSRLRHLAAAAAKNV